MNPSSNPSAQLRAQCPTVSEQCRNRAVVFISRKLAAAFPNLSAGGHDSIAKLFEQSQYLSAKSFEEYTNSIASNIEVLLSDVRRTLLEQHERLTTLSENPSHADGTPPNQYVPSSKNSGLSHPQGNLGRATSFTPVQPSSSNMLTLPVNEPTAGPSSPTTATVSTPIPAVKSPELEFSEEGGKSPMLLGVETAAILALVGYCLAVHDQPIDVKSVLSLQKGQVEKILEIAGLNGKRSRKLEENGTLETTQRTVGVLSHAPKIGTGLEEIKSASGTLHERATNADGVETEESRGMEKGVRKGKKRQGASKISKPGRGRTVSREGEIENRSLTRQPEESWNETMEVDVACQELGDRDDMISKERIAQTEKGADEDKTLLAKNLKEMQEAYKFEFGTHANVWKKMREKCPEHLKETFTKNVVDTWNILNIDPDVNKVGKGAPGLAGTVDMQLLINTEGFIEKMLDSVRKMDGEACSEEGTGKQ